jgi:hypothetical protein
MATSLAFSGSEQPPRDGLGRRHAVPPAAAASARRTARRGLLIFPSASIEPVPQHLDVAIGVPLGEASCAGERLSALADELG